MSRDEDNSIFRREIYLEPGRFYFVRIVDEELPHIARLEGWNGDVPLFQLVDDPHRTGHVEVAVLGETRDPFRGRDEADPPPA